MRRPWMSRALGFSEGWQFLHGEETVISEVPEWRGMLDSNKMYAVKKAFLQFSKQEMHINNAVRDGNKSSSY